MCFLHPTQMVLVTDNKPVLISVEKYCLWSKEKSHRSGRGSHSIKSILCFL